ncbi:MAG TPA: flagellar motor switch protein FliM [Bacillales bacterium]|nr:flagellar motor switch protein FliM [Bacillales bacterium]
MADVLSQNEIDALLSAISTGEMDADELRKEKEEKVRVYDFKRAMRFSKDQIRSLTRIHENFARLLTSFFSAQLRTYVQISVASVDQLPYEEFIRSIPKMTILNSFEAPPLEGRLLLEVNPHIAYAMMDRVLGGQGSSVNKIENLTEIEVRIMRQIFSRALDTFGEAWQSVIEFEVVNQEMEVNPQFLQMVTPNETVIVISLTTTIGETSGMMNICLPHVVLEPVIQKLSDRYWMQEKKKERKPEELEKLKEELHNAPLTLKAELGQSEISVQEFLQLSLGDVIELNQAIDKPLIIRTGEIPKFFVQPGKKGKRLAVQIIEMIKEGDESNE